MFEAGCWTSRRAADAAADKTYQVQPGSYDMVFELTAEI